MNIQNSIKQNLIKQIEMINDEKTKYFVDSLNEYENIIKNINFIIDMLNEKIESSNNFISFENNEITVTNLVKNEKFTYSTNKSSSKAFFKSLFKQINEDDFKEILSLQKKYDSSLTQLYSEWRLSFTHTDSFKEIRNNCNKIFNFLQKTQDYKKIEQNILQGYDYIKINLYLNDNNLSLDIVISNIVKSIPFKDEPCLYLPKITKGTMQDYIDTYNEFKFFNYFNLAEKSGCLDLRNIPKLENIQINTHDLKPTNRNIEFKNKYNLIKSLLDTQLDFNTSSTTFYVLDFDLDKKEVFFNFVDLSQGHRLNNNFNNFYFLNHSNELFFDNLLNKDKFSFSNMNRIHIDIDKSIELINLIENINGF